MDLTPPPPPSPISLPPSVMHYFSPLESDAISGNFIFREKEIPLRGYATFDRLQLITQPQFTECAVCFTSERLLMSQKLDDTVVGWGVERKYISAIENCGLFSKSVRLILKDPTLQKKDSFELKFPEENFPKRKNAFITIVKMLDLCQACEEDRLEDFQILLQRNLKLVNRPIDSKENTLLIMACAKNKRRIARYLLTIHGIDINKTTEVKVIRNGEETTEVYGALYYACIYNMMDVVKTLLSFKTIDVNILYTNRLTALQYAIMKDILAIPSNPNSVNSYANIISLLMSSQKTTWKIAGTGLFAIPTQWMLNTTDETRMAILSCERANELPANLKQMLSKSITVMHPLFDSLYFVDSNTSLLKEKLIRYRRGDIVRMDSKTTIVSNATEEDATEDTFTLPPNKTTHVFLSYAWATDEDGRDNHFRVKYLNDILKKRGIITWFDSDRIQLDTNSLRDTLAKALYSTCCVLICITRQYEVKVNGGDESDFCLYELNIASTSPTLANVRMPVVMERSMLDISKWEEGRMRAEFGHKLYTDLSNDDNFEENCELIVQNIITMLRLQ